MITKHWMEFLEIISSNGDKHTEMAFGKAAGITECIVQDDFSDIELKMKSVPDILSEEGRDVCRFISNAAIKIIELFNETVEFTRSGDKIENKNTIRGAITFSVMNMLFGEEQMLKLYAHIGETIDGYDSSKTYEKEKHAMLALFKNTEVRLCTTFFFYSDLRNQAK